MTIKRYIANQDTTITDAFKLNNTTRGTNANMGASDILELFSIFGQVTSSSLETSRILIQFPVDTIISDRANKKIASSGSCNFILKLSNASHSESTPENILVNVSAVSGGTWTEGSGLDMEGYTDVGVANWVSASNTRSWVNQGGDFFTTGTLSTTIESVVDDLEVDVTSIVEQWISGAKPNNGFLIHLDASLENDNDSYYTKKFFARRSEFFFKRPWIEARFNSSLKDRRNNFFASSDLLSSDDNLNTLILRNSVRGQLKNIPSIGTGSIFVTIFSGTLTNGPTGIPQVVLGTSNITHITGGFYDTGIYTASVGISSSFNFLYDVWSDSSGKQLYTGSAIEVKRYSASLDSDLPDYILSMPDLQRSYRSKENSRFRVEIKNRDWDSNIYTVASFEPDTTNIEDLFFKIERIADGYEAIPYGTGSSKHTLTSYDEVGNYFDLDMSLLEPDYTYKIKYSFQFNNEFYELKDTFKFRVEK